MYTGVKPKFYLARHVTSRLETTRHVGVRRVEPRILAVSTVEPVEQRLDTLDTSNVSSRVETWRAKWNLGIGVHLVQVLGDGVGGKFRGTGSAR